MVVTVVHHPSDARIAARQIPALVDRGHRVTYMAPWSATGAVAPAGVESVDVPRARGRRRGAALLAVARELRRRASGTDVVLLHDPELLLAVGGLSGPTVVWDVHEDTVAALPEKHWLPTWSRPGVAAAVSVAEHVAESRVHLLLAEEGYRARFRRPHPVVANEPVVPRTVPAPTQPRAVYVGRISRWRGAQELVSTSRLVASECRVELIGPADPDVIPLLVDAAREGVLDWYGQVPNGAALQWIQGACAGLSLLHDMPNYRVSRPTKVVEYMSRGVPVVSTPNPASRALIDRHGCGTVVPYKDPEATAAAVLDLVRRPDLARRLGAAGHAAAREAYDWRHSGADFVAALEKAAASGSLRHQRHHGSAP